MNDSKINGLSADFMEIDGKEWPYHNNLDPEESRKIAVGDINIPRKCGRLHRSLMYFSAMVENALAHCLAINGAKLDDCRKVAYTENKKDTGHPSVNKADELLGEYHYKDELMFEVYKDGLAYFIRFSDKYKT